ncbi:MAG: double zinc ribbon domain-containing protein [Eubacterium sp.]|nr:double zinc ribbon domain-containing protein [Eubacterium sp.]
MKKFIREFIYPPRCPLCDGVMDEREGSAHAGCLSLVRYACEPRCKVCGAPLSDEKEEKCRDCAAVSHEFVQGRALFIYAEPVRSSIYRFKYGNRRRYAGFYAREFVAENEMWLREISPDGIIPVPMHSRRMRARGYNQAALVSRELGGLLDVPVVEDLLFRTRETKASKALTREQRKNNLKNAFKTNGDGVQLNHALLVDDIYTTGATADAAASALKSAGVREVYLACVCIGEN